MILALSLETPGVATVMVGIFVVALFLSTVIFFASRYKRCPSDAILVIYGRVGDRSSHNIHGGGALVWPLIQDCAFLSLTPMTIGIPLQNALSLQNIRIHVPSTFTVGISTRPEIMINAAERLLGLTPPEIEDMAREIIFGQLRLTVASLTIEQINQDRESFLSSIRNNVAPELNKIGLYLINVNITDITDESDYISSIGKKAAAEAINRAYVDVAAQEKIGAIVQAEANREREILVAEHLAEAEKGKKTAEAAQRIYVQQQETLAAVGESEAHREKEIKIAENKAGAILLKYEAEAKGIKQVLDSKASGYSSLMASCDGNARSAATLLMIEKIEDIVALQVDAIKNLKIDKITVWDSGNGDSSSTSNFISNLVKSIPPLQDVAEMAGVELPEYLGKLKDDSGSESGTSSGDRDTTA